jgi:hypothetical protein
MTTQISSSMHFRQKRMAVSVARAVSAPQSLQLPFPLQQIHRSGRVWATLNGVLTIVRDVPYWERKPARAAGAALSAPLLYHSIADRAVANFHGFG